jgi:membrane fusion protein, heavy metal efflux system
MTTRRIGAFVLAVAASPIAQGGAGGAAHAVIAEGRITLDSAGAVQVWSPLSGRVDRVLVHAGQRVRKGAPLAVISSDMASALADELTAEADAAAAASAYRRQRQFYRVHAETEAEFDAARDAQRAAGAALDAARANVSLLELNGRHHRTLETVVRAPVGGDVLDAAVRPGSPVQRRGNGAAGTLMFTVGEVRRAWVVAEVSERELASLHEGEPVTVRELGDAARTLPGRVARISTAADPVTCTATVWCRIADPSGLRAGAGATVVIAVR